MKSLVAGFLACFNRLTPKVQKIARKNFALEKATQHEVTRLQKNQARSLVGAGGVGFPRLGNL